jgi:penicillin-binding protein 2
MGLYLIRLWQLQFLEGGFYRAEAEQQQYREVSTSPTRGVIYDRHGELLVRNIPAYNVTVTPGYLPEDSERERAVLQRLSQLIEIPYSAEDVAEPYALETWMVGRAARPPFGELPDPGLIEMVDEVRYLDPFAPLIVKENVDRELALLIAQEGGVTMPGVDIQIIPRRSYTTGELTSQVIGFLGKVPEAQLAELEAQGYDPSIDRVGYAGVELWAEENLRGVPGRKRMEKDVLGQELRTVGEIIEPVSGDNVHLTLDVELQEVAAETLRTQLEGLALRRGVVIALDPRNGQVLALVSLPTYDNNFFAEGINDPEDFERYQALLDDPHGPLFNHAISDQIPPGSVFKIVPAAGALQDGIINRYTTVTCPGRILLPNKFAPDDPSAAQPFYCWNRGGHGSLNVVGALAHSCDVFFYEVGGGFEPTHFEGLGAQRLAYWTEQFGLGSPTGIDIPGELDAGVIDEENKIMFVPTPKWKRDRYQETWTTGDTYNMSIGQGFLNVTPLQMVNATAVVANGGTLYRPQVIHHITDPQGTVVQEFEPEVLQELPVDDAVWQMVREGMEGAVYGGTAPNAQVEGVRVAGKTGTAEYCDDLAIEAGLCPVPVGQTLPTHAWFTAYAPAEAPEIVVVAWLYNGGEGSTNAAPVAQKVLEFYFQRAMGLLEPEAPEGEGAPPAGATP